MSIEALIAALPHHVTSDAPYGSRTTYRVGGHARYALHLDTYEELHLVSGLLTDIENISVLGNGSNTLVSDHGFNGLLLSLGAQFEELSLRDADDEGRIEVRLGSALDLPVAARRLVEAGVRGFEWAVGVPGTVGGAVVMNAGGHGSDMAASVSSAEVWNLDSGEIEIWDAERLGFGYRHSNISPRHVVLSAVLTLREGDSDEGREELREIVRWRREHQPGGANAGSVFQNPDSVSAGAVIDACGLKGRRHGSAHVSEKHANFIMVDVPGSAEDVVALMDEVRECVARERGVELHSEIRLVGF